MMKKAELLAPAGSPEALRAAVLNGADAVYLGAESFSARSGAQNFTRAQLEEAVRFCHLRGAAVHLAVNTVFLKRELEKVCSLIRFAAECGVDACIVQDLGALEIIKKTAPDMEIHASTQMTVHSPFGIKILEKLGVNRAVLAREMSRFEIKKAVESTDIETEVFVHGALCICYSGKCLFSSFLGGRSGNRGKCAQPCRLPYTMNGKKGYLLSPHDNCLAEHVKELCDIGVSSLKIEGRMKSPQYVAAVTGVYRKIIDTGKASREDLKKLHDIFCRGTHFTDSYYIGKGEDELINAALSNDKTGKNVSGELLKSAEATYASNKDIKRFEMSFDLSENNGEILLKAKCGGAEGIYKTEAEDAPAISAERAAEQLAKLGSTPFKTGEIKTCDVHMRISALNALRREAVSGIENKISESFKKGVTDFAYIPQTFEKHAEAKLCAAVRSEEQAMAAAQMCDTLFVPLRLLGKSLSLTVEKNVYALMPLIIEEKNEKKIKSDIEKALKAGVCGFICDSLDAMGPAFEYSENIVGGFGLNITNPLAANELLKLGAKEAIASAELCMRDVKELSLGTSLDISALIYGRVPLMTTKHCFMKGKLCGKCEDVLKDRNGVGFPIRRAEYSHGNVIFNSRPLYLGDKDFESCKIKHAVMSFTTEKPEEILKIIHMIKEHKAPGFEFTRGGQSGGNRK